MWKFNSRKLISAKINLFKVFDPYIWYKVSDARNTRISCREVFWKIIFSKGFQFLAWNFTKRRNPSHIFFKDFAWILRTPFSTTHLNGCFQNNLPDKSNILLRFVKAIYRKFCLCTMETTYSRDILLPNILLSVLQFFQFCLILPILLHRI